MNPYRTESRTTENATPNATPNAPQSPQIVEGTKAEAQSIRWVQLAQEQDDIRPVLGGTFMANGAIVGCDGKRLHATLRPECLGQFDNGDILNLGKVPASDFIAKPEKVGGTYPNLASIKVVSGGDQAAQAVKINVKYLTDALKGLDPKSPVTLVVRSEFTAIELAGMDKDGRDCYALIMPVSNGQDKINPDNIWKPEAMRNGHK